MFGPARDRWFPPVSRCRRHDLLQAVLGHRHRRAQPRRSLVLHNGIRMPFCRQSSRRELSSLGRLPEGTAGLRTHVSSARFACGDAHTCSYSNRVELSSGWSPSLNGVPSLAHCKEGVFRCGWKFSQARCELLFVLPPSFTFTCGALIRFVHVAGHLRTSKGSRELFVCSRRRC